MKIAKNEKEVKALQVEEEIAKEQLNFANEEIERLDNVISSKNEEISVVKEKLVEEKETVAELREAVDKNIGTLEIEKNKVFSQKKHLPNYIKAIVVIPNKQMNTARTRTLLPKSYSKENAIYNLSHTALTVAAFFNEDWEMLKLSAQDRFHQKARMKMLPELFSVQKVAYESGALMSTLSGSGSTFFNMVYAKDTSRLVKKLEENFPHFRIMQCDFDNDGIIVED